MALTDDVKRALGIVDVVSEYVQLDKLHTRSPEAPCPFHEERTPSFKLNLENDTWRCYGACNDGGDIFSFVMRAEGISFAEALDRLCDMAGIERRQRTENDNERKPTKSERESVHELNALAADYWHKQLRGDAGTAAREYLESRGIDIATAQQWGIGYAPSGSSSLLHFLQANKVSKSATMNSGLLTKPEHGSWRDMFSNRIMYALRDRSGDIIGFGGRAMEESEPKYINTSETPYFQKSELVYGLDRAADAISTTGRAVIVEGYMDVITAHLHGFRNVVACMGTAVTRQQLAAIATALPHDAKPARQVVMCLDNDNAGVNATLSSLGIAMAQFSSANTANAGSSPVDVKVARPVSSGDGAPKDPDEAIRQDPRAWWQTIETPSEAYEFAFESQLSNGAVDDAISAAMPFIGRVPPSTVAARRRIEWMSQRVNIEYDDMIGLLIQRRHEQAPVEPETRSNRRPQRRANPVRSAARVETKIRRFRLHEYELVAILVQDKNALEYAGNLAPEHFESTELGSILELRKRCSSTDELARVAATDESLYPLYVELTQHTIEVVSEEGNDDPSAWQSAVVNACSRRVLKDYLRRLKRLEDQTFRQEEVQSSDERLQEALTGANQTNLELRTLTTADTSPSSKRRGRNGT